MNVLITKLELLLTKGIQWLVNWLMARQQKRAERLKPIYPQPAVNDNAKDAEERWEQGREELGKRMENHE